MENFIDKLNKALNYHKSNQLSKALEIYLELFKTEKNNLNLLYLIGTNYIQAKKPELSINYFELALKIDQNHLQSLNNLGGAYYELDKFKEAVRIFEKLLRLDSKNKSARNNLANCYAGLKKYQDALKLYQDIVKENQNDFIAFNNIGNIFKKLNNPQDAIKNYKNCLKINNKYTLAYNNLGELLCTLGLYKDGLKMYQQVSLLNPDYEKITSKIIHTKQKICNWDNYENLKFKIINDVKNLKSINPFILLSLIDDPKIQKLCSETFINKKFNSSKIKEKKLIVHNKKPKIAYFSSDFKNHPILQLSLEIFKNHDRSKFEIIGFSLAKNKKDEWNKNIEDYFSEFIYVHNKSDEEIADLSRKKGINIAIDLNGFTNEGRQGIFFNRAAPIQINFLGYPGTMGAKFYDYIIADKILIPETKKENFTEKVIYQNDCYQPNIRTREISTKTFKRTDFNLPENQLIYCNFNSNYKITPQIFNVWMEILKDVPNSVFWIYADSEVTEENLKKEARLKGIDLKRIIFAKKLENKEHLKRIKLADIFLDTFPYGAHTTASDAIRMGLPIITIKGESFASRVSSSILKQVNLDELSVSNIEAYKELAVKVANNKDYLDNLNKKLLVSLKKTSLFDSQKFTKNLESTYTQILKKYEKN